MKSLIVGAVLVASVIMVSMVYARGPMGGCGGPGCGGPGCNNAGAVSGEQWKQLQADSIELREQMMTKRFALEKENLKATPDAARVAALETELTGLRTKMQELRSKAGLPTGRGDGPGYGYGGRMNRGPGASCGSCPEAGN